MATPVKTKVKLCICFGNHALQQQHERNSYNTKLNLEKIIFQHRLGSCWRNNKLKMYTNEFLSLELLREKFENALKISGRTQGI